MTHIDVFLIISVENTSIICVVYKSM